MQTLQKYKKTELGKIPEEWSIVQIQDICKTSSGGTPSRSKSNYYKGDIPWIKTGELKDGYIFETEEHISKEALKFSSAKLFPPDTVLFAMYGATIGKTAITKISTTTNQACCAFLPLKKETIDPYFLQQYFILVRPKIISKGEGAGQPNTSQDFLKTFRIIYPPFQEQQKIASILSNVDELIQKIEQIIEQTQRLKKGLMQILLTKGIGHTKFKKTEIGEIPEEWNLVKLEHICHKIIDGTHFTPKYTIEGVPFLRITDIQQQKINWKTVKKISLDEHNLLTKRCKPEKGDVLLSKNGTVGITKIVDWNESFSIFVSLCLIKPIHEKIKNFYLTYILPSELCFKQIRERSKQGTVTNLHLEEIRELLIPLPDPEEQQKIASIISNVNELLEKHKMNKEYIENLKKGLMQQLLTGKIRVKV